MFAHHFLLNGRRFDCFAQTELLQHGCATGLPYMWKFVNKSQTKVSQCSAKAVSASFGNLESKHDSPQLVDTAHTIPRKYSTHGILCLKSKPERTVTHPVTCSPGEEKSLGDLVAFQKVVVASGKSRMMVD